MTYLTILAVQASDASKAGFYNVGPDDCDCVTTGELVELFKKYYGDDFKSVIDYGYKGPHEANFLKLDTSLIKFTFDWRPTWYIDEAVEKTVEWTKAWMQDSSTKNINRITEEQIEEFIW